MTTGVAGPRPGRIVGILLCVVPLSQIPLDIYTPAMPDMVTDLSSTSTAVQATVTAYMVGLAVGFVPVGVLADAWGRKRVLTACMGVTIVASLACAAATTVPMLLGARFVQGLGACACMVLSYAVAADCFRGRKLTSVAGLLGAAWGLAPVIAPAVGGVLAQFLTWRLIFVLIAAMTLLVGIVVVMALPETLAPGDRVPVDVRATSRTSVSIITHPVSYGAFVLFGAGTAVILTSALTVGSGAWALTIGAALALAGCGILCPQMYGLALGLFTRNLGLVGGIATAASYLIVSAALTLVGVLPETSPAPLGWLYAGCGLAGVLLLGWATSARHRTDHPTIPQTPRLTDPQRL